MRGSITQSFVLQINATILATASWTVASASAQAETFNDVWQTTTKGAYAAAPSYEVRLASFFEAGTNILAQSADRTLTDSADILPSFQKLVHPIGICFSGTWSVTETSPYTGYFAKGSQGLIVVRASEALGQPLAGDYRAFGFAGKIFPTMDASAPLTHKTANFFTVDDLGGARAKSFLDDPKTNEPKTSFHLNELLMFPLITEVAKTFALADANPGIRQVYEIAELGLTDPSTAVTPHWMSVVAETTTRTGALDFRDELRLANYPDGLQFGIYVAEIGSQWLRLGSIHLTQEALSEGCDHRLHFQHPQWK